MEKFIRNVPDFPKPGILFKDITPLLGNAKALKSAVDKLAKPFKDSGVQYVVGIESRGFIFGSLVAQKLKAGFVPVRKPGKLPAATISESYELEYGTDTVQIHADAIPAGAKVLMVDDLLATGGTMSAACRLVEKLQAEIMGVAFVIELCFLNGKNKLSKYPVHSLMKVS